MSSNNRSSRDPSPRHVGSMNAFKILGKKLLNTKGHGEDAHTPDDGRKPNATHHLSMSRPKSASPANRQRSSSLFQRNKSSAYVNHGHQNPSATKSSASINNMVAHNINPFAPSHASDVLGTGTGIATPRVGAGTHHSVNRKASGNFPNHLLSNENIVYNPYGLNAGAPASRPGTAYAGSGSNDLAFYMQDGNSKLRLLPLPIADPNSYLPEEMKQSSVHLTDNFVFDSENHTLGSGGSSEVRKVRSAYRQKDVYALKKLNMIYDESAEKFYKRCSKEFIIAKHLSHNVHIANTYYLVKVPTTTYTTRGWGFVMEICVRDLFQMMERSGWKAAPLNEKFCLFKQIANGVKFCHDQGVAHRDLKPENVLLSKDGICKLTDFGISDWYHVEPHNFNSPVRMCEGMIGSPPYTPPEVMLHDAKKHYPESMQKPYNPLKMDSYALGMILIALVNNILPFFESCNTDSRFREYETSYENFINHQNPHFRDKGCHKPGPGAEYTLARNFKSADASRVAWRLADPNPETRYTMEDLYADPWFQNIETCVEPDDEYTFKAPEIRKTSSENSTGSGFYINEQDSKEDVSGNRLVDGSPIQHTSNPFLILKGKPRSMVDIAQSPSIPKPDVAAKVPSRVAEDKEAEGNESEVKIEKHENENNDNEKGIIGKQINEEVRKEEASQSTESNLDDIMSSPTPTPGQTNEKQNDAIAESNHAGDNSLRKTIPNVSTLSGSAVPPTRKLSDLSLGSPSHGTNQTFQNMTHSSSASLKSMTGSGKLKKKKVVHNHMDVPASVTSASSARSFSSR